MAAIAATADARPEIVPATHVAILGEDAELRERAAAALARDELWPQVSATNLEVGGTKLQAADIVILIDDAERFSVGPQVQEVHESLPGARVIVAAKDCCDAAARTALRAGASGVIGLEGLDVALAPTARAVAAGQICLPSRSRDQLQRQSLTTREKQTLALVVMGMTNCEIAARLFLAESTVKSHLSSAFQKLGVRSRNEAAAMILDPASGVGPGILTIPTQNGASGAA